jgi:predicted transcriptional regulator
MGRPKNTTTQPTSSELAVLQILWQTGPSTAREVHDKLAGEKQVRYTSTLKTMQVMESRGLIRREIEGQKHIFHAVVAREDTQTALLDTFLHRTFGGSALRLVMKALGNYEASQQDLDQLKEIIRQKENQNPRSHD